MPARTSQTGANEHTEHKGCNTPTGPKRLKVLVLGRDGGWLLAYDGIMRYAVAKK